MTATGIVTLNKRQRAFVNEWLLSNNAAAAAKAAGYANPDKNGAKILRGDKIQRYLEFYWKSHGMTPEEIIGRLAQQGRGSLGDFVDVQKWRNKETGEVSEVSGRQAKLNLAKGENKLHLIKKYKFSSRTIPQKGGDPIIDEHEEIELYDSFRALSKLADINGMTSSNVNLANPDGSLQPQLSGDQLANIAAAVSERLAAFDGDVSAEWDAGEGPTE